VIIGHTTFCIVLVQQRARPAAARLDLAERGVGGPRRERLADVWLRDAADDPHGALVAGALLSLALSFDEIAVTFFLAGADTTTLPLWILGSLRKTQSLPDVNAVAGVILVLSLPLIAAAAWLMRDEGAGTRVVQGE